MHETILSSFCLYTYSSPKLCAQFNNKMVCQVEEMSESHDTAMQEMEATHKATLATLQEEHARTVKSKSFNKESPYK